MISYDVIVVGAGASGLMATIKAARMGKSVLLLEHKEKIGRKILATGNGKCNYTNLLQNEECYRGDDSSFALKVLKHFNVNDTIDFFEKIGIKPKKKGSYVYPNSEQASSILDVLSMELVHKKVKVHCNENVNSIIKEDKYFAVKTDTYTYYGFNVILSTGGCAYSSLGSDGSGYDLATSFGHTIIKPLPALTSLKSNDILLKKIAGVRVLADANLYVDNVKVTKESGEIQFVADGISGIPIFQLSRFASKALWKKQKVEVLLDFLPFMSEVELFKYLKERFMNNEYKSAKQSLVGLLNSKLNEVILTKANIDISDKSFIHNEEQILKLVNEIKKFSITVQKSGDFTQAQVSAGGVSTNEIDQTTLESTIQKGIYLTGELIDIDGTCGGYNLQWAWTTGYLAGKAVGEK